jgi:ornithine carbamoyltransferase
MRGRSLLTIADLSSSEIDTLLDTAREQKAAASGDHRTALAGKTVVLLFDKPSLRTRVSFERATRRLGADALYLSPAEVGLGSREPIKDVARVLSRYCDAIVCRTFGQEVLVELDEHSSVPVINALSDWEHPCQTLADLLTMREHGGTRGRTVTFVGDGNNVARSLALGAASEGMHVRLVAPAAYTLDGPSVAAARERAVSASGSVTLYTDPAEGVRGADVVYTDVWTSMGQEAESAARVAAFTGFQVTIELLGQAGPDAILMHDLPAHRDEEISDEAIEGRQSVVFDQAENRLHAQQALLWHVLR